MRCKSGTRRAVWMRAARPALIAAVGLCGWAGSARADRQNSDAPPVDPQTELAAFKVADGLEVNLFAAEPMLLKPIGMNFDNRGRLWVAGSQTYPQVAPGDVPNDKIFILEDTDGDGKADKSTVFAEGLFIPASVEMAEDGGVYVANSTELIHLKDTDGDGKADQRQVVLSGFGTEDTHHIIHQLRWDYGGRLNFLQGIYVGSRVETPYGTVNGLASTLWQLRPSALKLDIFCQGLINPWGVTWDRYGQMFLTDGAGGEGVNFAPPGTHFTAAYNAQRILKGLNPGSPKYCGAEVIGSRRFPDDWQGDLITHDFRANRTVRFKLSQDGSGFSAKLMPDVIVSEDHAYRPVDAKMGPDGALYIADWYNPIINHGEVDFRDPRRDKVHGRIWRVTFKGQPKVDPPRIADASVNDLLPLLDAPESWTRQQARLRLRTVAPSQEVASALKTWVGARQSKESRSLATEQSLLEALWSFETIERPEPELALALAKAQTPQVRAAAIRVVGHWSAAIPNAIAAAGALATDADPRVRLEAVAALGQIGRQTKSTAVVPLATQVIDLPMDVFLEHELYRTLSDLKDLWLASATANELPFKKPEHLTYALKAVQSGEALKRVAAELKSHKVAPDQRKDAYDLVADLGGPPELSLLLDDAVDTKLPEPTRIAATTALESAIRQRKNKPDGPTPARVKKLMKDKSPVLQLAAIRLAGLYKVGDARQQLEQLVSAGGSSPAVRVASAQSLAAFGPESIGVLKKLAGEGQPPAVRAASISGLASLELGVAADQAAALLSGDGAATDPAPVVAAFLQREGGVQALSKALAGKKLPADTAKLALRYVQGVGVEPGELGEIIRTSAGAGTGGPIDLPPEELKQTVADAAQKGDAARGEAVFRSRTTGCYQCHMIGGVGGTLAPDLRAIGASAPADYIVESLLNPAKAVKDGFAATTVTTTDGDLIQGIKVRETEGQLVLRDNLRDEFSIPLSDIKKRVEGGSLMPAGLTESLTRQEFLDLVRFLTELGKPGPYSVPTEPLLRRWRSLEPVPAELQKPGATPPAVNDESGWFPLYTHVNGMLTTADLADSSSVAFLRGQVEAPSAGPVNLQFNSATGLAAWANDKPAKFEGNRLMFDAVKGVNTVTIRIDKTTRSDQPLRVEIASPAIPVQGK